MGFARKVANRVIFMDEGQIIEEKEPEEFLNNPENDRPSSSLARFSITSGPALCALLQNQYLDGTLEKSVYLFEFQLY